MCSSNDDERDDKPLEFSTDMPLSDDGPAGPDGGLSGPPSQPSDPPPVGHVDVEGCEVRARLGRGGIGAVYEAVQLATDREVALKFMHNLPTEKARRRFEREVELARALEHPNIARVYDSGLHKDMYFYAMQLVRGQAMDDYVRDNRLDRRDTLRLVLSVARGVEYAHRRLVEGRQRRGQGHRLGPRSRPGGPDLPSWPPGPRRRLHPPTSPISSRPGRAALRYGAACHGVDASTQWPTASAEAGYFSGRVQQRLAGRIPIHGAPPPTVRVRQSAIQCRSCV